MIPNAVKCINLALTFSVETYSSDLRMKKKLRGYHRSGEVRISFSFDPHCMPSNLIFRKLQNTEKK